MKSLQEELPLLKSLIDGLAKAFGQDCEVVLHDYSNDFNSSIVAIANGQVTGRKVGESGTNIGLKIMLGTQKEDGIFDYITQTRDGRFLRSSTIYIKNDDDKVVGSLCINNDITSLVNIRNQLDKIVGDQKNVGPVMFDNVEDILLSLINESINQVGTPVALMTREQKIEGINYLNDHGAFKIKNAGNIVAQYYDISRFTIYNYINGSGDADDAPERKATTKKE